MKKIHLYLHVITSSKNTWNIKCSMARMCRRVGWTDPNTEWAWQRASESVERVFEGLRRFRSRNCRKRRQFENGSSWMGQRCHISNEMCWKRWGMSPRYEGHVSNRIETVVDRKGVKMRISVLRGILIVSPWFLVFFTFRSSYSTYPISMIPERQTTLGCYHRTNWGYPTYNKKPLPLVRGRGF